MDITKKKIDGADVLEFSGKLDVTGSQEAHDAIIPAITPNGVLILDMSNCDYVSSSGLRILMVAAKQSALVNCKTVLAGIRQEVWDVIVMTGFEDVLTAYPSAAKAAKALTGGVKA